MRQIDIQSQGNRVLLQSHSADEPTTLVECQTPFAAAQLAKRLEQIIAFWTKTTATEESWNKGLRKDTPRHGRGDPDGRIAFSTGYANTTFCPYYHNSVPWLFWVSDVDMANAEAYALFVEAPQGDAGG